MPKSFCKTRTNKWRYNNNSRTRCKSYKKSIKSKNGDELQICNSQNGENFYVI